MSPAHLKQQISDAFNAYAVEGIACFKEQQLDATPVLSHICFKFTSMETYADYVEAARDIGTVTQKYFNGKQVSWCHLKEPLQAGKLKLEWLEMVEPCFEKNAFDGVDNIGYMMPKMPAAMKLPSTDGKMQFRCQSLHASTMAMKPAAYCK